MVYRQSVVAPMGLHEFTPFVRPHGSSHEHPGCRRGLVGSVVVPSGLLSTVVNCQGSIVHCQSVVAPMGLHEFTPFVRPHGSSHGRPGCHRGLAGSVVVPSGPLSSGVVQLSLCSISGNGRWYGWHFPTRRVKRLSRLCPPPRCWRSRWFHLLPRWSFS